MCIATPAISLPVLALLNRLTDRFDRAQQSGRPIRNALRLDDRTFPELYLADVESEKEALWRELCSLDARGLFELKLERALPFQAEYERTPKIQFLDEARIREAVGRPVRVLSETERWRAAVSASSLSDDAKVVAGTYFVDVPGRTPAEVMTALERLPEFVDSTLLLREVSARLFWGQSKVLDGRQRLVQAILGATDCPFPDMPVQLHVFLPHVPITGVLFIENLATFEQQIAGAKRDDGLAIVYAAGFKGSAHRLRAPEGSSLYWSGRGSLSAEGTTRFQSWLYEKSMLPCWFWGDLDFSGMRILAALKRSFPETEAWAPGYAPMLAALIAGHGHLPESAGKVMQAEIDLTGCTYSDEVLLPAIRRTGRFFDQEGVTPVVANQAA